MGKDKVKGKIKIFKSADTYEMLKMLIEVTS